MYLLPEPGDLSLKPRSVVVRLGFKQPLRPISADGMLTHTGPTTGEYIPYQWLGAKEETLPASTDGLFVQPTVFSAVRVADTEVQ